MGKLYNLARMTTATTGTGTITLGSAVSGYLSFASAGVSSGDVVSYAVNDGSNSEIGYGTYTTAGTTLTRTVVKSTNSNTAINLSGTAQVFITPRAEDLSNLTPQMGGRITISSGAPVMTTDATAATSVYYAPAVSPFIAVYDGNEIKSWQFTSSITDTVGLTLTLGSNWAAATLFDMFTTINSGAPVLATVAWSSSAAGTSTRATALALYNGLQTNASSVTARINNTTTITMGANQGTYVGTFLTNGSTGQVDFKFGSLAAGGGTAVQSIWNAANRTQGSFVVMDSTATNGTSSTNTWQPFNVGGTGAGLNNRINMVLGLSTDALDAEMISGVTPVSGQAYVSVGLNSSSAVWSRSTLGVTGGTVLQTITARGSGYAPIGLNYFQALYYSTSNSTPFSGNGNEALISDLWW